MKTLRLSICTALVASAVLTGCHTGGAYTPRNTQRYAVENDEPFVAMSSGVQRSVTCSGIQQRVREDGRLELVANLRNREARRIQIQVSCVFKDENGFPTGDETPWQDLILTERAQEGVKFVSMNEKARKYTVRAREAR